MTFLHRALASIGVVLTICVALSLRPTAQAPSSSIQQNLSTTVCPGAGCVDLAVGGLTNVSIQLAGTFSGTVTFRATTDGTNYVALSMTPSAGGSAVTTATAAGLWNAPAGGYQTVRAVFTSYVSGNPSATISAGGVSPNLLVSNNTWTGTNTFDGDVTVTDATCTGTCTGFGGGGGGNLSGTLTASRIPVASGAQTVTDSANLTWDLTYLRLMAGGSGDVETLPAWPHNAGLAPMIASAQGYNAVSPTLDLINETASGTGYPRYPSPEVSIFTYRGTPPSIAQVDDSDTLFDLNVLPYDGDNWLNGPPIMVVTVDGTVPGDGSVGVPTTTHLFGADHDYDWWEFSIESTGHLTFPGTGLSGSNAVAWQVSTAGEMDIYRTAITRGATDYEAIVTAWSGTTAQIGPTKGGTGTLRGLELTGASLTLDALLAPSGQHCNLRVDDAGNVSTAGCS